MKKFFFNFYIILIINLIPLKTVYCEVFIVAQVNNEIITNVDLNFEKKYLVSLNPNLKKLDPQQIMEYAKDSLINERNLNFIMSCLCNYLVKHCLAFFKPYNLSYAG